MPQWEFYVIIYYNKYRDDKDGGGGVAESLNLLGQCAQPLTVIPLYRQLRKLIENEIAAGRWKPNERIPSEAELSPGCFRSAGSRCARR